MHNEWKAICRYFDGTVTEMSRQTPAECLSALAVARVTATAELPSLPFDDVLVMSFVHIADPPAVRGAELAPVALAAARAGALRDLEGERISTELARERLEVTLDPEESVRRSMARLERIREQLRERDSA